MTEKTISTKTRRKDSGADESVATAAADEIADEKPTSAKPARKKAKKAESTTDAASDDSSSRSTSTSTASGGERSRLADSAVTVSTRSLLIGGLIAALVAGLLVFAIRDFSARNQLHALQSEQSERETAERIAGEYAVNAATLDYQDLTPWINAMQKGVSPELSKKYEVIGQTMEQVLTPLRMKTTAELVTAKTEDVSGDVFRVVAVVNIDTTTVQTPAGGSTVAVYTLVLDRSKDWMITDVGDPTRAIADNLGTGSGDAPNEAPPAGAPAAEVPAPEPPTAPTPGG